MRTFLTKEEALSLLPDEDDIHTFRGVPGILIGADWYRDELVTEINRCTCEIGGEMCRQLGHGLVIWTGRDDPLFVKVDDEIISAFLKGREEQCSSE